MDFETSEIPGSRDFVKDFLEGLNHDNSDPEKTTAYKIADKMEHYEQLTFADLMRGEKLKYLRGDVYELRIPIKKVNMPSADMVEYASIPFRSIRKRACTDA